MVPVRELELIKVVAYAGRRHLISRCNGPVAQWIERLTSIRLVAGSNPAGITCFRLLIDFSHASHVVIRGEASFIIKSIIMKFNIFNRAPLEPTDTEGLGKRQPVNKDVDICKCGYPKGPDTCCCHLQERKNIKDTSLEEGLNLWNT